MNPPPEERPGDVLDGFHLYDRPLLVSYPRSGTNWLRYIIEFLSDRPTPGQTRLVNGDNYVIDRAHCGFRVMHQYRKVVLVVRDYRECLLRQHQDIWEKGRDVPALLTDEAIECPASWYRKNIEAFDVFKGDKLLVYFEDLMTDPGKVVGQLAQFFHFEPENTRAFLEDIDTHFRNSVAAYRSGGHDSVTSGTKDLGHHARTKLSPEQVREFDDYYFSRYPNLAAKYLGRYRQDRSDDPMSPVSPKDKRLRHILLSLDGRWLLDWTPRAASHGIVWTFFEANGLLAEAKRLFPEGDTRLHDFRFHHFYHDHGYCSEDDLFNFGRLRFKQVRNPYDRVVTSFLHLRENRQDFEAHSEVKAEDCTFLGFLEWLSAGNLNRNVHWMPQRQPFEEDLSFWDYVIRAEDLPNCLAEINERWGFGLNPPPARVRHSTTRAESGISDLSSIPLKAILGAFPCEYGLFYNAKTYPIIESLFGDDAQFYGYACPYCANQSDANCGGEQTG